MPDNDVRNEIKLVLEMTARVDERVKLVVEKQSEMTSRLNSFIDAHNVLSSRVSVLEAKGANGMGELKTKYESVTDRLAKLEHSPLKYNVEEITSDIAELKTLVANLVKENVANDKRLTKIEEGNAGTWNKAKYIFDWVIKAVWAIIVGYLLWKLGFAAPLAP